MKDIFQRSSYLNLPSIFYEKVSAASFKDPQLILFNSKLATELHFDEKSFAAKELAEIFSGQNKSVGTQSIALAYAGFQFAHPVPLLGDGRALLLGELNGCDIQLKGSGQTPYSRRGDGRSALGPVIREYVVSEFMHTVGVPTTRALAAVVTGEDVFRQFGPEPGGVFTRVASSHIRVGTFQYCMFKKDENALKALLDFTIERHYPELKNLSYEEKSLGLLSLFSKRQGELIALWSGLGFIHGVMNTDNCSLAGITIDYGPCAFMDEFSFNKVFSSIDERGRYSFFNQVPVIQWNILRLADSLLPLISDVQEEAIKKVEELLRPIFSTFSSLRLQKIAEKMGISDFKDGDEKLVMEFLEYMQHHALDFTLSFRNLPKLYEGNNSFYPETLELKSFIAEWKKRVSKVDGLDLINPLYIPRNHLVQKAISLSYEGDYDFSKKLIEVLVDPFVEREGLEEFALPPKPAEKVQKTFCGT